MYKSINSRLSSSLTQKEQPPRLPLFLYLPEPQGSFLCGLRCQPNGNLIGKVVEKSGIAWYNGSVKAVNLPDKSEVDEDYYEL